ncbi:MAG: hypothetical protein AAF720_06135 [Pseudomonadota bacterium]
MDDQTKRLDEIYRRKKSSLDDLQKQRDLAYDKSFAAPRPSDDFIRKSLGKSQNGLDRALTAGKQAEKELQKEQRDRNASAARTPVNENTQDPHEQKRKALQAKLKRDQQNARKNTRSC